MTPVPYGWWPSETIPRPAVTAADRASAADVAALPEASVADRVARLRAADALSPGALLALLDAEPVAVAELATPWGRASVACAEAIAPDALGRALAGTPARIAAEDWTSAERACVVGHPAVRSGYLVGVTELLVFAAHDALGVYLVTPVGRAGTFVASPDQEGDVEDRLRVEAERYFSLRPPERVSYEHWLAIETEHLVVRYAPDAVRPVRKLARRYESAVADICRELGLETPEGPITVWSYEDRAHQRALWSSTANMALPAVREVHMKANATPGHELTHVLARDAWGEPGSRLLDEGLATLLNGSWDATRRARHVAPVPLDELVDDFRGVDEERAYLLGAAFVAWVRHRAGPEGLRAVWAAADVRAAVTEVTGLRWPQVDADWGRWLRE